MHAELANLNPCAVPFLSRAAVNLSWYDRIPDKMPEDKMPEDKMTDNPYPNPYPNRPHPNRSWFSSVFLSLYVPLSLYT